MPAARREQKPHLLSKSKAIWLLLIGPGLIGFNLSATISLSAAEPDQATVQVGEKINAHWGTPDEFDFYVGSAGSPSFPFTELDRVSKLPDYDNDGLFALLMAVALLTLTAVPLAVTLLTALGRPIPGQVGRAAPGEAAPTPEERGRPPGEERPEEPGRRAA